MIVRELLARLGMSVDGASFQKGEEAIKNVGMGFTKLYLGLKAAQLALQAMTNGVAENAARLDHAQRITGLSAERLQELEYAASRSGVSTEELQHGLVHLARSAQEAATNGGEAGAAYQRLGIHAAGADGKVRPMGDLLNDVVAKLAEMPDGTAKAATAMELFGRSGAQLIPLLDKGPDGLAKMASEAKRLGVVMGGPALASALKYQEAHKQMFAALEGVKNAIATALFPALTRSTAALRDWLVVHRQLIALRVKEAFEQVSNVLQGLARGAAAIVGLFERLWRSGGVGKAVLIALGAAVVALVAPWTALAAAIALVAEDVEFFLEGKHSVLGLLVAGFKKLGEAIGEAWSSFKADPFGFLYDRAEAFFVWLDDRATKAMQAIVDHVGRGTLNAMFGAPPGPGTGGGTAYAGAEPPSSFDVGIGNMMKNLLGVPPGLGVYAAPADGSYGRGAGVLAPQFAATINVYGAGDAQGTGILLRRELDDWWSTKLREAGAAVDR